MDSRDVASREALSAGCDELLGWSVALRIALKDDEEFLVEWMPLAACLVRQAAMVDAANGDRCAWARVVDECNAVLSALGLSPLSVETYRCAMRIVDTPRP